MKSILIAGAALLVLAGCSSSGKTVTIHSNADEFLFKENKEKFYSDAKSTKIWVATYKTKSDIRVRSHFIDIWVKQAQFDELEYMPDNI